jgi:hypothetical protein
MVRIVANNLRLNADEGCGQRQLILELRFGADKSELTAGTEP